MTLARSARVGVRSGDTATALTVAAPTLPPPPVRSPWVGLPDLLRRWPAWAREHLPRGNMLRPETWAHRHRLISRLALVQAVLLGGFGLVIGSGLTASLVVMLVAGVPALLALSQRPPRTLRMLSAVVSLMFASAGLVELTNGLTESHFHFFVMLGVVALYQDWSAFGMCVLVTVLHHAVMGLLDPGSVFGSSQQQADPVLWAGIHGVAVLAASLTHMIAWKLNEQQQLRDPLTQLPNRTAFVQRLRETLRQSTRPVSVMFVDVDNFKTVNDSGGHHVGDAALFHVAQTMTETLGVPGRSGRPGTDGRCDPIDPDSGVMVARLGGDEFAVLMCADAGSATLLADRVAVALRSPVSVEGRDVFVTASIGVTDCDLSGSRQLEDLLRDADLAMYVAKSSGRNRVVTYDADLDTTAREQARLEQDLHQALDLDQLEVHYQPVVRSGDGSMCGVEALVRWRHPELGLIPPHTFIPLAEENGAVVSIGAWVLRTAARQVAAWQRELPGCADLELAVNLSPAQLRDPELLPCLGDALHASGLSPRRLTLEVTESTLLSDLDLARRQLDAVRTLGVLVAIDDFGTGYSSLSYLARLPADQVKIDRSFVQDLVPGATAITLVRSIVDMARALDLDIQAEGVEEPHQQEILTSLGCPRSQGFLFSRPMPATDFPAYAAGGGLVAR